MKTFKPTAFHVTQELTVHQKYRSELIQKIPDIDDETLADTLEGLTSLTEMLAEVLRSALIDQALAQGLRTRMDEMQARHERYQRRIEKKREIALRAMVDANIATIIDPEFTANLRKGARKLEIADLDRIPDTYLIPQPPKLDQRALLSALSNGQEIDGARLIEGREQLSVRTK